MDCCRVLAIVKTFNLDRFPEDFMFQLTAEESVRLRSQIVTLKTGRGQHRKYLPYAFTEQGIAGRKAIPPPFQLPAWSGRASI